MLPVPPVDVVAVGDNGTRRREAAALPAAAAEAAESSSSVDEENFFLAAAAVVEAALEDTLYHTKNVYMKMRKSVRKTLRAKSSIFFSLTPESFKNY